MQRLAPLLISMLATTSGAPRPAVIGTASSSASGASTLVLAKPSGVTSGDQLIAIMAASQLATWTGDTGWTEDFDTGSSPYVRMARKTAGGSEPSSYTFTASSSPKEHAGVLLALRGGTLQVVGSRAIAADPIAAPSITVTADNSLLLAVFLNTGGAGSPAAAPTGMTPVIAYTSQPAMAVYSQNAEGGATGTRSVSFGAGGICAFLLSVQP